MLPRSEHSRDSRSSERSGQSGHRVDLTNSALSVFRECPRKYQYTYEMGRVRQRTSAALSLGTTVHGALEAWWREGGSLEAAAEWLQQNASGLEEADACRVTAMIRHYRPPVNVQPVTGPRVVADPLDMDFETFTAADHAETQQAWPEFDVVAVEHPFHVEIENPRTGRRSQRYTMRGKVDGLLRKKSDGTMWILEHKTTSEEIRGFGPYWQRLSIDHQISYYILATGAQGVLYDVLRKPAIRPCRGESFDEFGQRCIETIGADPERYYQFREIHRTTDDIREAAGDLWQQAQLLGLAQKQQFFPRNSGACRSIYGLCPFLDVCTGRARIDDDSLFRTKTSAHEELEERETEAAA